MQISFALQLKWLISISHATPSNINMLKPSYNRYNTRSQMVLDIPLQKTYRAASFFFEPKICTKIGHITNNVKPRASYTGSEERKFKETVSINNCFEFERNLLNKFVYSFSFFFLLCHLLFRVFSKYWRHGCVF